MHTPWLEPWYEIAVVSDLRKSSDVAREFGLTERALRFYEAKGLITSHRQGSCRYFAAGDVARLAMVLKAKRMGFTLAEIRRMLDGAPAGDLGISRRQCVEQIRMLEARKREIEAALAELRRAYSAMYVPLATPRG